MIYFEPLFARKPHSQAGPHYGFILPTCVFAEAFFIKTRETSGVHGDG